MGFILGSTRKVQPQPDFSRSFIKEYGELVDTYYISKCSDSKVNLRSNMIDGDVAKKIGGKVILVTGGTGSIGGAVVSRLLKYNPKQIVVFSRDEKKQWDMANDIADDRVKFVIGDVRDQLRVNYIMQGIDLVFHAAALKQVPSCELFPMEAVLTNITGSYNVIYAAIHHNIERVVVLSTDKAVYPSSAMGMTKALMERIMIAASKEKKSSRTIVCGARLANVMYTRSSVIPYFIELIKAGRPLKITDPTMTRFLMPLEQLVDLVVFALTNGCDGEIYVRKASATSISDLAKAMASIFSYNNGTEIIGIRPGERMHEALISDEEAVRTEDCGDYYKINPEVEGMDIKLYYSKRHEDGVVASSKNYASNTSCLTVEETEKLLLDVPETRTALEDFKTRSDR